MAGVSCVIRIIWHIGFHWQQDRLCRLWFILYGIISGFILCFARYRNVYEYWWRLYILRGRLTLWIPCQRQCHFYGKLHADSMHSLNSVRNIYEYRWLLCILHGSVLIFTSIGCGYIFWLETMCFFILLYPNCQRYSNDRTDRADLGNLWKGDCGNSHQEALSILRQWEICGCASRIPQCPWVPCSIHQLCSVCHLTIRFALLDLRSCLQA